MDALKKLIALLLLAMISTTAFAITDAQVFAYAEANYPSIFTGTATAGQYQQYNYRYYPVSGNYLAVDTSGVIYILGPYTGGVAIAVGPVSAYAATITAWEATQFATVYGEPTQQESSLALRSDIVFYGGFEADAPGSTNWNKNWGIAFNNRIANSTIVTGVDAIAGSKAIRIDYPQGGVGPNATGMQFPIDFTRITGMQSGYDSLYLRYYVYFEPGFDFVKGGKLPGLMGGSSSWRRSGGSIPDGTDGWTLRFMWLTDGEAVIYAYLPPGQYQQGVFGTVIKMNTFFTTGIWICLEQFVKLNTIGQNDGKLTVWMDGVQVLDLSDVNYRTVDNAAGKVSGIYVSTFHGGDTADWAPSVTSYARFDGFVAALNRVGPYLMVPFPQP